MQRERSWVLVLVLLGLAAAVAVLHFTRSTGIDSSGAYSTTYRTPQTQQVPTERSGQSTAKASTPLPTVDEPTMPQNSDSVTPTGCDYEPCQLNPRETPVSGPEATSTPSPVSRGGSERTVQIPLPGSRCQSAPSLNVPIIEDGYPFPGNAVWLSYTCSYNTPAVIHFYKEGIKDQGWAKLAWAEGIESQGSYGRYRKNNEMLEVGVYIMPESESKQRVVIWAADNVPPSTPAIPDSAKTPVTPEIP